MNANEFLIRITAGIQFYIFNIFAKFITNYPCVFFKLAVTSIKYSLPSSYQLSSNAYTGLFL